MVAVLVTCEPGSWFEQGLSSLAAQDYPNLSVLVIDAASEEDPSSRVAAVLPTAEVMRLEGRVGFSRAANEALKRVEGASHLLFCHDDVVLAPDAVRCLLEEAVRSKAGIATPKYVRWDEPERLLALGATADKVGVIQDLVDPGELDQQQRDSVREVFVAPAGAMLVRAELFRALGGFNVTIDQFGEDLDFSWRAQVAGARVVAVPAARVRHLEAICRRIRPGWRSRVSGQRAERLRDQHRVRTLLTCYSWFNLVWIIPIALLYLLGEASIRVLQGRPGDAGHLMASYAVALREPGKLWRSRRRVQGRRRTSDRDLRHLQTRGSARLRTYLQERLDGARSGVPMTASATADGEPGFDLEPDPDTDRAAPVLGNGHPPGPAKRSRRQQVALVGAALMLVLAFGSRSLLGHSLPAVAQLPNLSAGWSALWRSWWSTWQPAGLGVTAPSSPALALLGLLATVFFGAVGTLQHVIVLGPLVLGPLGAYRAARWWGSHRGRLAALIAYAVVPLPYNALARGHWDGLVAYAVMPWVVSAVGRISGEIPMPGTRPERTTGRLIGLGILVAVAASAVPSLMYVVPLVGFALLVGSVLVGRVRPGVRMLVIALAASAIGIVLLMPWSAAVLGSEAATVGSTGAVGRLGFGQVLRFATGPIGSGPLGWALLVAAALPLLIGRGWRLAWATRLWVVALTFFWLTWAGGRGWIPALPAEVGLAPAATALAGSVALGVVAFELDLPGFQFGWRQLAVAMSAVALAGAALPVLAASDGGRWHLPNADASSVLAFLPGQQGGGYRVLWVGAPDALPLAARTLSPGIGFATSDDGEPDITDQWITGQQGSSPAVAADLRLVQNGLTTRFGHLLAPMAVRYVVIPNHNGPAGSGAVPVVTPGELLAGLQLQTDLEVLNVDPNYTVYENAAWAPVRVVLPPAIAADPAARTGDLRALQETDLGGAIPVLDTGGPTRASGSVPLGSTIYVAQTRQSDWRLHVAGTTVRPQPAFGWGMSFPVPSTPTSTQATATSAVATLSLPASLGLRGAQVAEILLWLAAMCLVAFDLRRRRVKRPASESVSPEWFAPLDAVGVAPAHADAPGGVGAEDLGEELRIDA